MTRYNPEVEVAAMQLLEAALDFPSDQRSAFIAARHDQSDEVRARALQLLRSQSSLSHAIQTGGAALLSTDDDSPTEIGAYRVVRTIGSGGMGAVFLAERLAGDFHHQVAIKIIKTGRFSDALIERFRRERQTLAQLNHPHIARLYDGGEMPDGAPYLVMEYVQGVTLSEWVEAHDPDQESRISLYLQICDGVEYAHQNLVIHRDLTPSNILVTDKGDARLIDFGIARPHVEPDDGATGSTFSGLSLTPGFAAPERLAGAGATTLVDIYSLGKILEILMGSVIVPELAAIASKAQAADPATRYPTVSALKEAVLDWRERRPVEAFSNAAWYRFCKFVNRERIIVGATVAISIALLGGLLATALAYGRAERERANAEQRFAENRSLSKYLIENVVSDLEAIPGTATIRQGIAERGRLALEGLSNVPGAPPDLLTDTAVAYRQIGQSLASPDFKGAARSESALAALAKAEHLHRQLVRQFPQNAGFKLELAKSITAHAFRLLVLKNDPKQAGTLLDEADALLARLSPSGNTVDLAKLDVATVRAGIYGGSADYQRAYTHIDKSVALARSVRPKTAKEKFAVASAINTLLVYRGDALWYDRDDKAGALTAYRASLRPLEDPQFANDIRVIKMQVFGASNLASTLFALGRKQEALGVARAGIDLAKRMRLFDDSIRALQLEATIHGEYALELYALGRLREGDAEAKTTLDIRRELRSRMPGSYEAQRLVPVAQRALGEALQDLGQTARACDYYRQTRDEWRRIAKSGYAISNFDKTNEVRWAIQRLAGC